VILNDELQVMEVLSIFSLFQSLLMCNLVSRITCNKFFHIIMYEQVE
jgi:hypothetical protein